MINISYDSICVTKVLSGYHVCVVYIMKVTSLATQSRLLSAFLVCGSGMMQSPLVRQTQMCLLCDPLLIDARVAFVELLVGEDRNVRRETHTLLLLRPTQIFYRLLWDLTRFSVVTIRRVSPQAFQNLSFIKCIIFIFSHKVLSFLYQSPTKCAYSQFFLILITYCYNLGFVSVLSGSSTFEKTEGKEFMKHF